MVIQTRRLFVRRAEPADAGMYHALWNDPRVMTNVGFPLGLRIAREEIEQKIAAQRQEPDVPFGHLLVVCLADGRAIGECKMYRPDEEGVSRTDVKLRPEYWGHRYGREIKAALVDYLFAHTDCQAVEGTPNVANLASIKMQEAVGGVRVGGGTFTFPAEMAATTQPVPHFVYHVYRHARRAQAAEGTVKSYPFMQVDAFTEVALGGNPCAILFDADDLSADAMLAIAKEMNLSETAFVQRSEAADFGARFFTPAEEIPLAGHPTIATIFALVESGRLALQGRHTEVTLALKAGVIGVEITAAEGRVEQIIMTQKKPEFLATYSAGEVLPAFGLAAEDALPGTPIQTVSTGTPQLMIPLRSLEALRRARLDAAAYTALRKSGDFFSPHLFVVEGVTSQGQTFARHFGVPPDTMEDPFTGSATGGMAAYLWRYGLLEQPYFTAEQGHWMARPGQAQVEVVGPRDDIEAVKVGGAAVTVLRGEFQLPG